MSRALTVFIGSPSDVPDERRIAREVVHKVDARVARFLDVSLRAIGWEEVRPGLGRPQELINQELDRCDLFVGILYARWGTSTGEYTSGFEEELERIRARQKNGESVEAMLYIRALDDDGEAEPAMREFRGKIRTQALLRQFEDPEHFGAQLWGDLSEFVAECAGEAHDEALAQIAEVNIQALVDGPPTAAALPVEVNKTEEQQTAQARDALERFAAGDQGATTLVRAHLAVAARMSGHLTGATLDVHDVNRLYEYRDHVDPDGEERSLLLRTAAAHGLTAPVWGLVQVGVDEDALTWLAQLLFDDREDHIRAGAAVELGPDGIHQLEATVVLKRGLEPRAIYEQLLQDGDRTVVRTVIEAIAARDLPAAEEMLRAVLDTGTESVLAFKRLAMLLAGRDPVAALELATTTPAWVEEEFVNALRTKADELPRNQLETMLDGDPSVKVIALQLFAARSDEMPDIAALLDHNSANVRRGAVAAYTARRVYLDLEVVDAALKDDSKDGVLRVLTRKGPSDEEARRGQFELRTQEERRRYLNWTNLRGGDALAAAVAAGDNGAADLARRSLGDELAAVRSEHIEAEIETRKTEEARVVVREIAAQYENLMDQLWLRGALGGLASAAEVTQAPSDADLAIRHIDETLAKDEAGWLLAATATADHVDALISAAADTHRDDIRKALLERAVVHVGPAVALKRVAVAQGGQRLLRQLLMILANQELEVTREDVMPHLVNSDTGVRRAALRVLIGAMSKDQMRGLLDEVASSNPRYYDVVGLLDRMVYGPGFAQERARRALMD